MSASTRTAQRTLGTSQLGGMIVLLAVLAAIVAAIAFGTLSATKSDVAPEAGAVTNPVVDLVPRHEIGGQKALAGYWQPDGRGGLEFVPTGNGADNAYPSLGGWNHPPVPSSGDRGGLKGPGLDAR